jgi:benzylsuccinate CoA-transferase BbsF subunit
MRKFALEGVRVADFGWAWAGAYSATLLAFMGAEVIKIESRKRIDYSRIRSLSTGQWFFDLDQSPVFNTINLNKMSVTLDLSQPQGVVLAKRIVGMSDVVIQNMRPGAMERLGLGYEALREIKPDIVYLSSSARGSAGPESQYVGYAPNFAALGGISYITGYAGGPPTRIHGEMDLLSATTSALAILAALVYRSRTGKGQHIDLSSTEAISALLGDVLLDYTMNGNIPSRNGNSDEFMSPHNCYRCKGEDKWVSIAIGTDEEWKAFCQAIGNPPWTGDERFGDAFSRRQNQGELDRLVGEWTAARTHYEVMETLQKAGVAAVPSFNSQELFNNSHLQERGYWLEVDHPMLGKQVVAAPPWKLLATPAMVSRPSPLVGEHNHHVFGELLGLSPEEIAALIEEKVIF